MLLFSALLTQHAHSLMDKDDMLSVFILISFFFLVFHFSLCYFNKFIVSPENFLIEVCSQFWCDEIIQITYQCTSGNDEK